MTANEERLDMIAKKYRDGLTDEETARLVELTEIVRIEIPRVTKQDFEVLRRMKCPE